MRLFHSHVVEKLLNTRESAFQIWKLKSGRAPVVSSAFANRRPLEPGRCERRECTHYINHCCEPNAYMRITHGHVLFFALRDIPAGEEITIDYEQTLLPDSKRCRCGAQSCRGKINKQ